jgi:superfamily II DNA or RNA helicase
MLRIVVDNQTAKLYGGWNRWHLDQVAAYTVFGAWFSPAYHSGSWDGKKRLYRKCPSGYYKMPSGFVDDLCALIEKDGIAYELEDNRDFLCADPVYELGGKSLQKPPYDYQADMLDAALAHNGGVIQAFTGAGKTNVAAAILKSFDVPSVFLVHRKALLYQAQKAFEAVYGHPVGIVGDGICNIEKITVAMIQTLDHKRFDSYLKNIKVFVADEVHHLESEQWTRVIGKIGAIHRYGVTATPSLVGPGRALVGYTGPIIYEILPEEGIRRGVLVPPEIYFIDYDQGSIDCTSKQSYTRGISGSTKRTAATIRHISLLAAKEARPLVLFRYLNHASILASAAARAGLKSETITGKVSQEQREAYVAKLLSGEIDVLFGQVQIMGEGVDIPELRAIINVTGMRGGGSSQSKNEAEVGRLTAQILGRGLRRFEGKDRCYYLDFNDTSHPALVAATEDRKVALRDYGYGQYFRGWSEFLV